MSSPTDIVFLAATRTPMGGMLGGLAGLTAPELAAAAIRAAIERSGIEASVIDEGIMGCVLPGGVKQGPARQAMRQAGIPDASGATTINKLCGSGMKAAMLAGSVFPILGIAAMLITMGYFHRQKNNA